MRALKPLVSIFTGLVLLTVAAPPAEAAVPRIPLTCGMTVHRDAVVYLARDLTCPDFGVLVEKIPGEENPVPHVVVDLRGHTLRGTDKQSFGIRGYTFGGFETSVKVINGRLRNWGTAVSGEYDVQTRNVDLVGNRTGFGCYGTCLVDRTSFRNNDIGYEEGEALGGIITHSTFVGNRIGTENRFIWSLSIDHSIFARNDIGVLANDAEVTVSRSLFVKNRTAVKVLTYGNDGPCARLTRDIFVRNGVNLDGPRCAA